MSWLYNIGLDGISKEVENYIDNSLIHQMTGARAAVSNAVTGNEVYEGDMCIAEFRKKGGEIVAFNGKILMDDFMWCIEGAGINDEDYGDLFSLNRVRIVEVIGNIYEDPHLLNKEEIS